MSRSSKLTFLIHKNIRSVRNSHGHELTDIENDWSECDVKHMFMSPIKTTMSVLKILTYIITSITVCPVRLAAILVIMSVLNFKTNVILQYAQRFFIFNISQFMTMRVTNWPNIFVDQGQFSDSDSISSTHQREHV
jgi:hypothetical protein